MANLSGMEIYGRLRALRERIEHDSFIDGGDNALFSDVAVALGLGKERARLLAGDDGPEPDPNAERVDETLGRMARWLAPMAGVQQDWMEQLLKSWWSELFVQRCDDCGRVIKTHDDARWHLSLHQIRCEPCAERMRKTFGYDEYESLNVV
jgi:hypothetical protein